MRITILAGCLFAIAALSGCGATAGTTPPTTSATARVASESLTPSTKVSIVSAVGAAPGQTASVSVQTNPNIACSLAYIAPTGSATVAQPLGTRATGPDGRVGWTWSVEPGTARGTGFVSVKCGDGSASATMSMG